MAIAAWKRIEKIPGYQRKKRFFKSDVMYTMITEEETVDDVI